MILPMIAIDVFDKIHQISLRKTATKIEMNESNSGFQGLG